MATAKKPVAVAPVNPFGAGYAPVEANSWIKWEKPGQMVNGMLIRVEHGVANKLKPASPQTVYTLQLENGDEVKLSKDNKRFNDQMRKIKLGQDVGILYVRDVDVDQPQPAKSLEVYAGALNPKWKGGETAGQDALEQDWGQK